MKKITYKTLFITFLFFGIVYMILLFTNRWGKIPYLIAGLSLIILGIWFLLLADRFKEIKFKSNILAVLSSIFLWGFFGEFLKNVNLYISNSSIEIAYWNYLPILLFVIFVFFYLMRKRYLPVPLLFIFGSGLGI